jgi:hypothetical protein
MRNLTRLLAAALFCGALFSAVFVGAQEATPTPTAEATQEVTTEPTTEGTVEATTEPTSEATSESTPESTAESTAEATTSATAAPTTSPTATIVPTVAGAVNVPANAQGVCDSDLILNLYVAEHYFGFDGVMAIVMSGSANTPSMVDVSKLDKGQFAPLFAAPIMAVPSTMMSQNQMQVVASMMVMDDNALKQQMTAMMPAGTDMSKMTVLKPAVVAGEDPTCSNLRKELNRFFTILAFQSAFGKVTFSMPLSGANEVPPADPDGTGTATVTIDNANSQICYTLAVQNIALPATAAHIHRGAADVKGDVVVPFNVMPNATGNAAGCVTVDPALLQEIGNNPAGFYVNVHSSEFPDGAVRGQLSG